MNRRELLTVIKELNQSEDLFAQIGEKKIVMIGKKSKNVDLVENFGRVMIKLDDAGLTDEISEDCIDFFEENVDEFMSASKQESQSEEKEEVVEEEAVEEKEEVVEEDVDRKGSKEKKKSVNSAKGVVMEFLSNLVDEDKYTRIEIVEKALEQFPEKSKNYFGTYLSDGKNSKYCRFESLIIVDKEGVLSFVK